MTIEKLRKNIDKIDNKIIQLLSQRLDNAQEIGKIKKKNNQPVINKKRESEIYNKIPKTIKNKKRLFIKNIYREIISNSRNMQR